MNKEYELERNEKVRNRISRIFKEKAKADKDFKLNILVETN